MKRTLSLKKNSDFQRILKKGSWYNGELISIYILKNRENVNYLGLAVGKKGLNSIKRNRIKRLIRESYRSIENSINKGYNIVILWKSKNSFQKANYHDIVDDMKKCFKKSNIME